MDIYITNNSALEFWRRHRRSKENIFYRSSRKKPPDKSPTSSELCHEEILGLTLPLDIMVGTLGSRRPSKVLRPQVCSKPLPDDAFVVTRDGMYVSSPEFCFFLMAGTYPFAKLIALGFELCGSYSLSSMASARVDQHASDLPVYNLPKLTSKKKLKAFAARMDGWRGHRKAIKALQYIADDSASPMETILAILLTLPYKYGGYGLPMPEMNGRIYPEKRAKKFSGREFYRGDLLWRKGGVVAEYNSDIEHASPDRIAKDAIRRTDLNLCGIHEVTVTKSQIRNTELLENVAKEIAARIGKRLRYKDPEFAKAHRELHNVLLRVDS